MIGPAGLLTKYRADLFQPGLLIRVQGSHRVEVFRMGDARADICPAIRLVLYLDKLLPLVFTQDAARRCLERVCCLTPVSRNPPISRYSSTAFSISSAVIPSAIASTIIVSSFAC